MVSSLNLQNSAAFLCLYLSHLCPARESPLHRRAFCGVAVLGKLSLCCDFALSIHGEVFHSVTAFG